MLRLLLVAALGLAVAAVRSPDDSFHRVAVSPPVWCDLRACPGVASVEVVPAAGAPVKRIVHLLNWHFV